MALDEEDVTGVDHTIGGYVNDHVAARMCGTHLDQAHLLVPHVTGLLSLEGFRRPCQRDAREIEFLEDLSHEGTRGSHAFPRTDHLREQVGRHLSHLFRAGTRGDAHRPLHELVPKTVIAIRVCVDQGVHTRGSRDRVPHGVQHPPGEGKIEERVHEQRPFSVDHQPGIAKPPGAVRLQPGPAPTSQVVKALGVLPVRVAHRESPPREKGPRDAISPGPVAPLPLPVTLEVGGPIEGSSQIR